MDILDFPEFSSLTQACFKWQFLCLHILRSLILILFIKSMTISRYVTDLVGLLRNPKGEGENVGSTPE